MRPATMILRIAIFSMAILGFIVPPTLAAGVKTSKERLSDKASDEQRVDNCRVPVERRGPTPRPDCQTATDAGELVGDQGTGGVPKSR